MDYLDDMMDMMVKESEAHEKQPDAINIDDLENL